MLRAFACSSHMSAGLPDEKIREIVSQSASFNRVAGVTGALLISGQQVFQYLEGPADGLDTVIRRIHQSRSHHTLLQLLDTTVETRAVPYWAMTRVDTGQTVVSGLVNAQWDEFGCRARLASPGMELLASLVRPHFAALGGAAACPPRRAQCDDTYTASTGAGGNAKLRRMRATSAAGGSPNSRLNSRLNCEGLA